MGFLDFLTPQDPDQQSAMNRALLTMGANMLMGSGQGLRTGQGIGMSALQGMQAYDQTMQNLTQSKINKMKMEEMQAQALADQQAREAIGHPGYTPSESKLFPGTSPELFPGETLASLSGQDTSGLEGRGYLGGKIPLDKMAASMLASKAYGPMGVNILEKQISASKPTSMFGTSINGLALSALHGINQKYTSGQEVTPEEWAQAKVAAGIVSRPTVITEADGTKREIPGFNVSEMFKPTFVSMLGGAVTKEKTTEPLVGEQGYNWINVVTGETGKPNDPKTKFTGPDWKAYNNDQVKAFTAARSVGPIIKNMIDAGFSGDGLFTEGGIIKRGANWAKKSFDAFTESDTAAANYVASRDALISNLARIFGQSGVLTDQDVNRVKILLPTTLADPKVAKDKFRQVVKILRGDNENKIAIPDVVIKKMGFPDWALEEASFSSGNQSNENIPEINSQGEWKK